MLIRQLIEVRKNPEQNPKVSVNSYILDRLKTTNDSVGGTPNLFVSFTSIDKLGINPTSQYKTPIGIYSYPADYVRTQVGPYNQMDRLPFAGNSEFANIFKVKGNIIDLKNMADTEIIPYFTAISNLWAKESGRPWKQAVDDIEELINDSMRNSNFAGYAGGRLWYVTMMASINFFGPKWKLDVPVAWNKLFRAIGIDGAVDLGVGIIHTAEPAQAVFFSITPIIDQQRVKNSYSPERITSRQEYGAEKHQAVTDIKKAIKGATPAQVYDYLSNNYGFVHINLVPDPKARLLILKNYPHVIKYVPVPTTEEQTLALTIDLQNLRYFRKKYDEKVLIAVLRAHQYGGNPTDVLPYLNNPSEELLIEIIKTDPVAIKEFPNKVTKAMIYTAAQASSGHVDWLKPIAQQHGVQL
jgi:hypothetical protein